MSTAPLLPEINWLFNLAKVFVNEMRFHLSGKANVNLHVTYTFSSGKESTHSENSKEFFPQAKVKDSEDRTKPQRCASVLTTFCGQIWP